MTEFERLFGDQFFIISSDQLDTVQSRLYGFALEDGKIIQNESKEFWNLVRPCGGYVHIRKSKR